MNGARPSLADDACAEEQADVLMMNSSRPVLLTHGERVDEDGLWDRVMHRGVVGACAERGGRSL